MSDPRLAFEHRVLKSLRLIGGRRWCVGVSGGVDSMVLAEVCRRWRRAVGVEIVVAHVHHGAGPGYRDEAQGFVRAWAREHRLPFVTNVNAPARPGDEASLRRVRFSHFARWRARYRCDRLVLGHHRDDALETRLIRLIRGTGPFGIATPGRPGGRAARPLAGEGREDIEAYARARGLGWREDPSNADPSASVRAWLRHAWLPALEARRPGATRALARSLDLVADRGASSPLALTGVRRAEWAKLATGAKARLGAEYLRAVGATDYGATHVHELIKRIDSKRSEFTFPLAGLLVHVTREFWWASRV